MKKLIALIILCAMSGLAVGQVADGLVAYYRFDGNGLDNSGNGKDALRINATVEENGRFNQCYSFNGTNEYIEIPQPFAGLHTQFTIELWASIDYEERPMIARIFEQWATNGGEPHLSWMAKMDARSTDIRANQYYSLADPPDTPAALADYSLNTWHHLAMTFDGETVQFFVDGALAAEETGPVKEHYWTGTVRDYFYIGVSHELLNWYKGKIDDFRVWDHVRTPEQIRTFMNVTFPNEEENTWQLVSTSGPSPRRNHAMAYDSARQKVVLFGGAVGYGEDSVPLGDTWEWDGQTWTQVTTSGPSARSGCAMAYDPVKQRAVLFGGRNQYITGVSEEFLNDTWEWDGSTWSYMGTGGPSRRDEHGMVYDSNRNRIILFGGSDNPKSFRRDTWEWNGQQWTLLADDAAGPIGGHGTGREGFGMAYDTIRQRVVIFGGHDDANNGDTWEWNGANWSLVSETGPESRRMSAMVYDGFRQTVVNFGGIGWAGYIFSDTWEWNGQFWNQIGIINPIARSEHAMVYDQARQRIVLFGGRNENGELGDTWEWINVISPEPTFTPTATPTQTPQPTSTPTETQPPLPTPTPSFTPTSTPVPTEQPGDLAFRPVEFERYEFNDLSDLGGVFGEFPSGSPGEYEVGTSSIGFVQHLGEQDDEYTDGVGLNITVREGEGSLLLGPVIPVEGRVLLRVSVRASASGAVAHLGALAAVPGMGYEGLNGDISINMPADSQQFTGGWHYLEAMYESNTGAIVPCLQVASNGLSDRSTISFDNLVLHQFVETYIQECPPVGPSDIVVSIPGLPYDAKKLEMALVPAGTFIMGCPSTERGYYETNWPQHQVTISQPFYIGKYEMTQAQWAVIMGNNLSQDTEQLDYPIQLSWNDCQSLLQELNGLGVGTFRLPTEAEWEYACRAGTETRFSFGDVLECPDTCEYCDIADQYMWWCGNNDEFGYPFGTKEVGLKAPNLWGLFDMHGGVFEWCSDWYEEPYQREPQQDPQGPDSGTERVRRSGFWNSSFYICRSAGRSKASLETGIIGIRLVREYP